MQTTELDVYVTSSGGQSDGSWAVDVGWTVIAADGKRLGLVEGVHPNQIVVSMDVPPFSMLFIPVAVVTDVEGDRVYLNVAFDDVNSQGWELTPVIDDPVPDIEPMVASNHGHQPVQTASQEQSNVGVAVAAIVTLLVVIVVVLRWIGSMDVVIVVIAVAGIAALGVSAMVAWLGQNR